MRNYLGSRYDRHNSLGFVGGGAKKKIKKKIKKNPNILSLKNRP